MAYTKTNWVNGEEPAISAFNLNKMEQGIFDAHDGLETLDTEKQDTLTFDSTPTADSTNPVTSAGIKAAIDAKTIAVDTTLTVSGAAADAKATGDRIKAAKDDIHEAKAPVIVNSASGSIAVMTDGADDMPMQSVAVNIAPVQSGIGDPSPTNVRPISGWTAVNVTRTGKNLWDEEWEIGDISSTTGENTSGNTTIRTKNYIPVKPGATCYCVCPGTNRLRTRWYGKNKNYIGSEPAIPYNGTFTVPSDAYYLRFTPQAAYGTTYNNDIGINYPATATAYEPYQGETYPVTLPTEAGTVYGGVLDVVKGTLTVEYAAVDLRTKTYTYNSEYAFFQAFIDGASTDSSNIQSICAAYVYKGRWATATLQSANDGEYFHFPSTNGSYLRFKNTAYTDANAFKASLNGVLCVYLLATPQSYTLTPTEIRTLLGDNVVYADAGAVDVQYPADTKLYIDGKIAEFQALVLENNG